MFFDIWCNWRDVGEWGKGDLLMPLMAAPLQKLYICVRAIPPATQANSSQRSLLKEGMNCNKFLSFCFFNRKDEVDETIHC